MGLRIITGIVGIALAIFVIQAGGMIFNAAALALMLIAWREYTKAFANIQENLAVISGAVVMILFWFASWQNAPSEFFLALIFFSIMIVLSEMVVFHKNFSVAEGCFSITGILYLGVAFSYLIRLRFFVGDGTSAWLWMALVGTWASDTFAYFSGVSFGKHKLCEAVSPKKTIEGFIGGVLGTIFSVVALGTYLFQESIFLLAMLGLGIALVATMGDLVESAMKRFVKIKDSGNLIPGHGGVWDRFDSVLFSAPFVYFFVTFFLN